MSKVKIEDRIQKTGYRRKSDKQLATDNARQTTDRGPPTADNITGRSDNGLRTMDNGQRTTVNGHFLFIRLAA